VAKIEQAALDDVLIFLGAVYLEACLYPTSLLVKRAWSVENTGSAPTKTEKRVRILLRTLKSSCNAVRIARDGRRSVVTIPDYYTNFYCNY
jgi:hypothetical protein